MERLVHIVLGGGDIVLESVWQRLEHIVDKTKHVVALRNGGDDDTDGILVVDLVDVLVIYKYLSVNAVNALYSAVYLGRLRELLRLEALSDTALDYLDECLALLLFVLEDILYLGVGIGVEVVESQILKLLFYGSDTESVSDRRIDVHGLESSVPLLFEGTVFQSPHIVEAVAELDYHNADILRHGKEYLTDILSLLLLLGGGGYLAQLCDTVH